MEIDFSKPIQLSCVGSKWKDVKYLGSGVNKVVAFEEDGCVYTGDIISFRNTPEEATLVDIWKLTHGEGIPWRSCEGNLEAFLEMLEDRGYLNILK